MCKNKSINRHCKQHADKDYGRNLPQGMRRISEIKTEVRDLLFTQQI